MPRKKIKRDYTEETMLYAIAAVVEKHMPIRAAARAFDLPETTVRWRVMDVKKRLGCMPPVTYGDDHDEGSKPKHAKETQCRPDIIYHCCPYCQGLLGSSELLKSHKFSCTGGAEGSRCTLFACHRDWFKLAKKLASMGASHVYVQAGSSEGGVNQVQGPSSSFRHGSSVLSGQTTDQNQGPTINVPVLVENVESTESEPVPMQTVVNLSNFCSEIMDDNDNQATDLKITDITGSDGHSVIIKDAVSLNQDIIPKDSSLTDVNRKSHGSKKRKRSSNLSSGETEIGKPASLSPGKTSIDCHGHQTDDHNYQSLVGAQSEISDGDVVMTDEPGVADLLNKKRQDKDMDTIGDNVFIKSEPDLSSDNEMHITEITTLGTASNINQKSNTALQDDSNVNKSASSVRKNISTASSSVLPTTASGHCENEGPLNQNINTTLPSYKLVLSNSQLLLVDGASNLHKTNVENEPQPKVPEEVAANNSRAAANPILAGALSGASQDVGDKGNTNSKINAKIMFSNQSSEVTVSTSSSENMLLLPLALPQQAPVEAQMQKSRKRPSRGHARLLPKKTVNSNTGRKPNPTRKVRKKSGKETSTAFWELLEEYKKKAPLGSDKETGRPDVNGEDDEEDDNEPKTCDICGKTFKTKKMLKTHIQNTHEKNFLCEHCSYRTSYQSRLKRHIMTHTGDRPILCDKCDFRTRSNTSFRAHMRRHTGERLRCDFEGCNYSYIQENNLRNHKLDKHMAEKRFKCTFCSYKTGIKASFNLHLQQHYGKKYQCSLCPYTGLNKYQMDTHRKKHNNEKSFFCDRCDYSTLYRGGMKDHIMTHMGLKPYKCSQCNYCSVSSNKVKRHISHTHNGDGALINLGISVKININDYLQNTSKEASATQQPQDVHCVDTNSDQSTLHYKKANVGGSTIDSTVWMAEDAHLVWDISTNLTVEETGQATINLGQIK